MSEALQLNNGFKMVNLKIMVPDSKYCCEWRGLNSPQCQFFDNHGGHATCSMGFEIDDDSSDGGYLKSPACLDLLVD